MSKQPFQLSPDDNVSWTGFEATAVRCFALAALETATPSARNYIGWFQPSQAGVGKLPAGVTMCFSQDEQEAVAKTDAACKSLADYDGGLRVQANGDEAMVRTEGWSGRIVLYAGRLQRRRHRRSDAFASRPGNRGDRRRFHAVHRHSNIRQSLPEDRPDAPGLGRHGPSVMAKHLRPEGPSHRFSVGFEGGTDQSVFKKLPWRDGEA
jgi:hypothetical protein